MLRTAVVSMHAVFLAGVLAAQEPVEDPGDRFVHQQWTVENGLPVDSVTDVVQTADGWLWIATFDGLLRFDGVRFTRFDTSAAPALRSNRIVQLLAAADELWILSEQGHLTRHAQERFEAVEVDDGTAVHVVDLALDGAGVLWLATRSGLYRVREERLAAVPGELGSEPVTAVAVDSSGRCWLATYDGRVAVIEDGEPGWTAIEMDVTRAGALYDLAIDTQGAVWVGTREGLYRYHDGIMARVRDVDLPRRAVDRRRIIWSEDWPRRRFLLKGPRGGLWESFGLSLSHNGREVLRLPDDGGQIHQLTFDWEGTVWLATNTQGLHALRPARAAVLGEVEGLPHKNVYSLHQDGRGSIWISDRSGGLARADCETAAIGRTMVQTAGGIVYDDPGSGHLLFGSGGELFRLADRESSDERWVVLENVSMSPAADELGKDILAIHRARDGHLLLGTSRGLWESRPGDPAADGWRFQRVEPTAGYPVRVLLEGPTGTLWLGTNGTGMARYRDGVVTLVDTADGLPSDLVRALSLDSDGYLWIGTEDQGLARLDPASLDHPDGPRIAVVQKRHGLWDDSVHQILEGDRGWLWLSSNRGIFRVRRLQLEELIAGLVDRVDSVGYTEADGMRHREANGGVQGAGLRACDGRFWFPTQDGVAIFDPRELLRDQPPPPVRIERLTTAAGRTILPDGSAASALRLDASERSFEIEYTALSFRAPERVLFRYRLKGYDERWTDAGPRRQAFFTKVSPGTYSFQVQARSADGVWNRDGATLALTVRPFYWETAWFRGAVIVFLMASAGAWLYQRDRWQRQRQRHLEDQVSERTRELAEERDTVAAQARKLTELDRAKSELFANVSHEFRTPLTLSLGPLQDLLDGRLGDLEPRVVRELERVHANSARLLELVNQLLAIARLDAGGLELDLHRLELGRFVEEIGERFVALAERRQIEFSVTVPDTAVELAGDREQLDKVLTNLLSNAFKFSRRGDRVTLCLEPARRDRVEIAVSDTGPGLAASEHERIFDRFYQAESATRRQMPGTGLGLALARDLVELHGGRLAVDSVVGEGSTFVVRLPVGDLREVSPPPDVPGIEAGRASDTASLADRAVQSALFDGDVPDVLEDDEIDGEGAGTDETTVLVVDDHPDLRAYVRRHLGQRYRVVEAADGAAGLRKAQRLLPDLVVSDVMMPEMDGFELTRALKQDPELDFVPVVLLTARAEAEDKLSGLGLGADDYLTKPFDVRELVARVDNLITQRRKLRQRYLDEASRTAVSPTGVYPRAAEPTRDFLGRVTEVIDRELADEDFQIDVLARRLAVSRTLLYERLAEVTETSPARLILERRMARAAELLRDEANVSETAYAVGFKSVSHFCQRFRGHFGTTPAAYRRAA